MRIDALHNLAIELEHKAQYAVRRRMLRPEIDGKIANRSFGHTSLFYRLLMQRPAFPGVPSKYRKLPRLLRDGHRSTLLHKVPIAPTTQTCSRLLLHLQMRWSAGCEKIQSGSGPSRCVSYLRRATLALRPLAFGLPKGRSDGRMDEAKRDLVSCDFGAWSRVS
jgi:hypothetical protein